MSLDDALFLIERDGEKHHCKGSELKSKMVVGDRVLVQRGSDHYQAWYGKPASSASPYVTRRCEFNNICYPDNSGDLTQHTDQPGQINMGYWWGCGNSGNSSPLREWRNFRNSNANAFVDLDGNDFKLRQQTLISNGSICRVTSDAGWKLWAEIELRGNDENVGFKTQYMNDAGRERVDLQVEGVTNTYSTANGEILTFDFFETDGPFDVIADDDLLLVWDTDQNKHVTGATFKSLFEPFDFDACKVDARAEYIRTHNGCETQGCKDIVYSYYIQDLKDCYDAAGQPYPSIWPPQLP